MKQLILIISLSLIAAAANAGNMNNESTNCPYNKSGRYSKTAPKKVVATEAKQIRKTKGSQEGASR